MIQLPDFKIDESVVPTVRMKSIHFENFKVFEDNFFDFSTEGKCKDFICLVGPNGCGKTTILEVIQLIFSRFDGRTAEKLKCLLGKSVRHVDGKQNGIYGDDDFLITAQISSSMGDYEVKINKTGFIKNHPEEIKSIVYRLCFSTRFDLELHNFQLVRSKWSIFKNLFEAVTGFEVEEKVGVFDGGEDWKRDKILNEYVLGFLIKKPNEIISHNECSAGERKIIKCFSTLLDKEYTPQIILVDNITMHVESGRHINLVQSMKGCFPKSQIFGTTHSYQISRNFSQKNELYDLRLIKASDLIVEQPWRLYLADEVKDCLSKLKAMNFCKELVGEEIIFGEKLLTQLLEDKMNEEKLKDDLEKFFGKTNHLFIQDAVQFYSNKKPSTI